MTNIIFKHDQIVLEQPACQKQALLPSATWGKLPLSIELMDQLWYWPGVEYDHTAGNCPQQLP